MLCPLRVRRTKARAPKTRDGSIHPPIDGRAPNDDGYPNPSAPAAAPRTRVAIACRVPFPSHRRGETPAPADGGSIICSDGCSAPVRPSVAEPGGRGRANAKGDPIDRERGSSAPRIQGAQAYAQRTTQGRRAGAIGFGPDRTGAPISER